MYSHLRKVLIRSGLKHMVEGFSIAVVRCKPKSIPHFAEEYFKALLSFRDENPDMSFCEVLNAFQQSQLAPSNLKGSPPKTIHRVESKEWEAGPLMYEARINQSGLLPRLPAGDSSETAKEDAQEFMNAQFLTSKSFEADIEQSDLDGIISADIVTFSPGPITSEMAYDLAVFRRKTTPRGSVHNSCGSSPTGECSDQGSRCGRIRSALFERVPLNEIGVGVDAVLIKTSMLPNVSQIVVQSEEVPEIIVFQADIKLTNSVLEPAFSGMEAATLNEENTTPAPALLTHCGPDTGDAMMAKTSESVELITSKCLVENSGDQATVETEIDSASQRSSGSASQQSSQSNIAAPVFSVDQLTVEMKESASHKSSASSIGAYSTADDNQITSKASAWENNLDSASQKSLLSDIVIDAVSSVCDDQTATTEVPDVAESVVTNKTAKTLEVQTESESEETVEIQEPEVTVQEASVLDTEVSASDLIATTSANILTTEVATANTDGTLGSQTTLQSQEALTLDLDTPDVQEASTEEPSQYQVCGPAMAEVKASNSALVISPSGAVEEPEAPVPTDALVSARTETKLSGAEAIHITGIMSPLPANSDIQEGKTQANGVPSLEVRAPYLVYLPLPSVEVRAPGMVPQVTSDGEEIKASPYVYIPMATRDLLNSPSFAAATTPQLSRTGSFAGPFVPLTETQRTQNSSQGHLGFSKIHHPLSHSPAVAAEEAVPTAKPSASSHHQASAAVTNNGQQPSISCCSSEKLQSKSSEPTVASACPCLGSSSNWRLCHLTHPGSQSRHQLPCPYQPSPSMSQCGLEHIAKIPMYQDCGLYCSCHHHMLRSRSSCGSFHLHHMVEPTCSGHALDQHHSCPSEHVCGHQVLPSAPAAARHHSSCWRATCTPLQPRHSSLVMCDQQEVIDHCAACGGACGHTKTTTVPSCLHKNAAPEACYDYKDNYNL